MAEVTVFSYSPERGPKFAIRQGLATATSLAIAATLTARTGRSRLASITLHLNIAGTTTEDFKVTLNKVTGATYDVVLHLQDLEVGDVTDLVISFDDIWLVEGDAIDVAWPNTEARTYGLVITLEEYK